MRLSLICAFALLALASADYFATFQYVGSSACGGSFVSGQLLSAGVCMGGTKYSCSAGGSISQIIYQNPDCTNQLFTSNIPTGCTGSGGNSVSVSCVASAPAPGSHQAQLQYFYDAGCASGTAAGYYYISLPQTCSAGTKQYQVASSCSSTSLTVNNCTDSSCLQGCVSTTYSTNCQDGQKITAVNCGAAPQSSTGGGGGGASSTGSSPAPYTKVSQTNCENDLTCSVGCHIFYYDIGQCVQLGMVGSVNYAAAYSCADDGTVTEKQYPNSQCTGTPSSTQTYQSGTCESSDYSSIQFSNVFTCIRPSASSTGGGGGDGSTGGGSSGSGSGGDGPSSATLNRASVVVVLTAMLIIALSI